MHHPRQMLTKYAPVILLVLSLATASAWGVNAPDPDRVPQRVLLGMTDDPAHSQTVTWRTNVAVENPQAQVVAYGASPSFGKAAATVTAQPTEYTTGAGTKVVHYAVTFTGLEPAKDYGYRVGDGTLWSEWYRIRTASDKADPFRFIYMGDSQIDIKSQWSRAVREAYRAAPDTTMFLYAGDLINNGYDDVLWAEWIHAVGFIGAMVPTLPAVGNHDMNKREGAGYPTSADVLWKAHFALPQNGPADAPMLEDEAYWVDYQGVRFIVFEGNAYSPEEYDPEARKIVQKKQVEWAEKLLANNPNRWTIMLHHEPMYGVGRNPDNPELRDGFLGLYDKYHVDLALQGHDHVYTRTPKLNGGKIVGPKDPGTVYVVSVSGPKMYPFNPKYQDLMKKVLADTQMYQVVDVNNDRIRLDAYSVANEWVDGFEIQKDKAGKSTLVDLTGPGKK